MGSRLKHHLNCHLKLHLKRWTVGVCTLLLVACSSVPELDQQIRDIPVPQQWKKGTEVLSVQHHWLAQLADEHGQLTELVDKALASNHQLRQLAFNVDIKKQQLIASGSALWPSLDLTLSESRRKNGATANIANSYSSSVDLQYELDVWGKLSANERQANLNFMAEQASFQQAKQQLVANVVTQWFAVIEARKQLDLYLQRVTNSKQNLEIIDTGYKQGINNALDVYLTRNELNNELARTAQQKDTLVKATRQLERLLGDYPKGSLEVNADLPLLQNEIPLGLPSELISRKPALVGNWYQLLAKDAQLAYAHKQRFPSLKLRSSIGKDGANLADMFSAQLGWSLLGSLTAPLFDAGRLKAQETQALLSLKQGEQQYLDSLYSAFSEVENAVSSESTLKERYQLMVKAQQNAQAAKTLSFEQYRNGLVSYTTVLDAQNRAFDAQSTVIQIKNQLIVNRIKLHIALGGDFAEPTSLEKVK